MKKANVKQTYETQAETLLQSIKSGVAPWVKPWQSLGAQKNAKTGREYNGGNALYLGAVQEEMGYELPLWLTWKQAAALGGHVKQGEWDNGVGVIWFRPDEKVKTGKDGKPELDSNGDPKMVPFWRKGSAVVYNVAQTTVKPKRYAKYVPKELPERNEELERFLNAVVKGSTFEHKYMGDRACYIPALDEVRIPPAKLFRAIEEFYSTRLHEYAHATGHKSRLARGIGDIVNKEGYAEEELVAELTAAFLGAEFQIDGQCQHAEYLGSWFKALENNEKYFYQAAGRAKKAATWIKNTAKKAGYKPGEKPATPAPAPKVLSAPSSYTPPPPAAFAVKEAA